MCIIDTHTHLYLKEFDDDFDKVIQRALSVGLNQLVFPSISSIYNKRMIDCYNQNKSIFKVMAGLHPAYVEDNYPKELDLVMYNLNNYDCIAVGEIGIDLFWKKNNLNQQKIVFEKQIEFAIERNLPVVIHCREAFTEVYHILKKFNDKNITGIFHCFTGSLDQAKKICDLNFKLGIGGIITFKNGGVDKFLKNIDINNIVLETDSPYMSPTPYRGKRNESSYIIEIIEKLSKIYGIETEQIVSETTKNAKEVFKL
jgi:TatD DNase family protein